MTTPHEKKLTTIADMLAALKARKTSSEAAKAVSRDLQDDQGPDG